MTPLQAFATMQGRPHCPPPELCAWAGRASTGALLRLRLVGSAIIHRGESLNRAATEEGLSRSALIRTIIKRYLQERDEKG